MSDQLPTAVWQGTFRLFGVDVKCAVLDNGQRVIEAESINALFAAMATEDLDYDADDVLAFAKWQRGLDA